MPEFLFMKRWKPKFFLKKITALGIGVQRKHGGRKG
jgi:hypothetical protein